LERAGPGLVYNLPAEIALLVLEGPSSVVGDAHADEPGPEESDNLGIAERRPTEGDDIVSAAAQGLSAGHPDEHRLLLSGRRLAALEERDLPWNCPPQLV